MIIRRVEVRNFRKLVEPTILEDLPDGLAIVVGDNEEGKSTLFNAIRSCFFDKHNMTGHLAQSFQPYKSALRPEVRVEFEISGQRYKLLKAFCLKLEAELVTPVGRLTGAKAEEELARGEGREYKPASTLLACIKTERKTSKSEAHETRRQRKAATRTRCRADARSHRLTVGESKVNSGLSLTNSAENAKCAKLCTVQIADPKGRPRCRLTTMISARHPQHELSM